MGMIFLYTDFGSADIYVGQVRAVLARTAPGIPVIDLLNDAPRFQIEPAAHLLAALSGHLPKDGVILAVVDPGVGTDRRPIVLRCDDRWFVGPDNGLLSVLAARCPAPEAWEVHWQPQSLSRSFHGRDLFAPIAARIAAGSLSSGDLQPCPSLDVRLAGADLWQVIYVDHYGNAFTGIRGTVLTENAVLEVGGKPVYHAGVFAQAKDERPFWYVNSIGLVEIACNRASAAERLRLDIGDKIGIVAV
jgi:S-adenosylmethionine hydrolase